jgi:hypothetical protein
MMKNLTLKTLLAPESYPASRKMATMIGKYFPKLNSINKKRCPDVPPLLLNRKQALKQFLPSSLANIHPGTLFKQFLVGWYNKIKTDYSDLAHSFNKKVEHYADAYYNWMERFIEMDYEVDYPSQLNAGVIPGGFLVKGTISNYSENISHRFGYPVVKVKNAMAGKFEKALIGIFRFFTPKPVFKIPVFEIVNTGAIGGEVQANEKPINKEKVLKWFFQAGSYSRHKFFDFQSITKNQLLDQHQKPVNRPKLCKGSNISYLLQKLKEYMISINTGLSWGFLTQPLIADYDNPSNRGNGFS